MDWKEISRQKNLSEEFMKEHKDQLDWYLLCLHHKALSESLIVEMEKHVNWNLISRLQTLSVPFIKSYIAYMNLFHLQKNKKLQHLTNEVWKELETLYQNTLERYIVIQDEIKVDKSIQISLLFRNELKKTKTYTSIEALIERDSESTTFIDVSLWGHGKARSGILLTPPTRLTEEDVCQNPKERNIVKNAIQYFLHQNGYDKSIIKIN